MKGNLMQLQRTPLSIATPEISELDKIIATALFKKSMNQTSRAALGSSDLAEQRQQAQELQELQELEQRGEQIVSQLDAETRWSDGQRIFAMHEQADEPHEVRSLEELNNYAPDQLLALPARSQQQASDASMTPPTNNSQAAALLAAYPADVAQSIKRAADARMQLAAGDIGEALFAAEIRQHLGVVLPPDWSGELRIVGVAVHDGKAVDAAKVGIDPQAFQVYARKADAQFGEDAFAFVFGTRTAAHAEALADRLRMVDALATDNEHEQAVKLARVQEERVRRDPDATEEHISAAREARDSAEAAALLNDTGITAMSGEDECIHRPG